MKRLITAVLSAALMVAPAFANVADDDAFYQVMTDFVIYDCHQDGVIRGIDNDGEGLLAFIDDVVESGLDTQDLTNSQVAEFDNFRRTYTLVIQGNDQRQVCSDYLNYLNEARPSVWSHVTLSK